MIKNKCHDGGAYTMMGAWSSCEWDKNDGAEGYGYIQLSDVDVNKEVEISRATAGNSWLWISWTRKESSENMQRLE